MEPKRNLILDTKRSNAINIAMKKLPTPQTIKAAIMKMDATVIGREGIEKLLTMLPTEEEKVKIQEAQVSRLVSEQDTEFSLKTRLQFCILSHIFLLLFIIFVILNVFVML